VVSFMPGPLLQRVIDTLCMHKIWGNYVVFVCHVPRIRSVAWGGGRGVAALGGKIGSTMNIKIILFPLNLTLLIQIKGGFPKNNCDFF
jgi:hypothetical protein